MLRSRSTAPYRLFLALGAVLLPFGDVHALTFLVGSDAICDFPTVQAAINAAQSNPGPDAIRVATNATYTAQALKVGSQDLEIAGGYASCSASEPTPGNRTTLDGIGGAADSVIEFTGAGQRALRNLFIRRGDEPDNGAGGGIQYNGSGLLLIENTSISVNRAGFGGGINFHGNGGTAELLFGTDTVVNSNIAAQSGGGVRLTGTSFFYMFERDCTITGNEALGLGANEGYGGGVLVVPPAFAEIASPGLFEQAAIDGNVAKFGGGIAVQQFAGGTQNGVAYLYTVDPLRPVRIANNRASVEGGGVFLRSNSGNDSDDAFLCAHEFVFASNRAPQGAAVFGEDDSNIFLNSGCGFTELPSTAVRCTIGVACNEIVDHVSETAGGQATNGATIALGSGENSYSGNRVSLMRNVGGSVLALTVAGASIDNTLLADNTATGPLVDLANSLSFSGAGIRNSTIAGNTIGGAGVVRADGLSFTMLHSIVQQPGKDVLAGNDLGTLTIEHVMASSCGLIDCGPTVFAAATGPRFIDPARGDYRLRPSSRAVDRAPSTNAPLDLDGRTRSVDLVRVLNNAGPRDLGAYERPITEPLVLNGGFDEDMNLWTVVTPGSVAHEATGANATVGAVAINDEPDPNLAEVVGLSQCVAFPGPGPFELRGFAYGDGMGVSRDRVSIRWRYFAETTSNGCTGTPTATGTVFFPSSSSFSSPTGQTVINVAPADFNERTQVEISLVVTEGSVGIGASTSGHFDGIRLQPIEAADAIFANGFEN